MAGLAGVSALKAANEKAYAEEMARLALSQPPVVATPVAPPRNNSSCYEATLSDGKFSCPLCGSKEGGTLRIISHYIIDGKDCPNKGKEYCQKERGFKGGRRKTKKTKKARKNRRRYSRRIR